MQDNTIILTSGLTGSSVLTGLISRAGYWTGDSTYRKRDYETHENKELIELNLRLFKEAGYTGNYLMEFSPRAINRISSLYGNIDTHVYKAFVEKCNTHRPWIWKDPRLWMTIRFWKNFLNLDECRFILLTRSSMQSWISQTLRRQITSYRYSRKYEEDIKASVIEFFEENKLRYLTVRYERLILNPCETLEEINRYLGTKLTVDNLKTVYHKRLYRNPRSSILNHLKAILIYLKNYSDRLDLAPDRHPG